jgi:cell division protein FtsW (lipid II flippase)
MMVMGLAPVVGIPLPLVSYRRIGGHDRDDLASGI